MLDSVVDNEILRCCLASLWLRNPDDAEFNGWIYPIYAESKRRLGESIKSHTSVDKDSKY